MLEAEGSEDESSKKKGKKHEGESASAEPKSKRRRRQKEEQVCEEGPSSSSASKRVRAHLQEAKQKRLAKEAEEAQVPTAKTRRKNAGKVNKKAATKDMSASPEEDAAETKKKQRSRKCCAYSKAYKATKGTEEEKREAAKKVPHMHPATWLRKTGDI